MDSRFKVKVFLAGAFPLSSTIIDLDATTKLCPRSHHSHCSQLPSLELGTNAWLFNLEEQFEGH